MKKTKLIVILLLSFFSVLSQKDSLFRSYASNEKLVEEGHYIIKNNKFKTLLRVGEWKTWDTLGNLIEVLNYKNDRYHGPYFEYHPNGVVKIKGQYDYKHSYKVKKSKEGDIMITEVPYGVWERFDDNGKLVEKTIYDKKGNPIKN